MTSSTAINAGIMATQETARMSFSSRIINPIASRGPAKAPTVSSDSRNPNALPGSPSA